MSAFDHILRIGVLSAAAALMMTAASAQEYSGAVTLGYANTSIEEADDDLTSYSLQGILDADFGNGFTLGADLGFVGNEIDDSNFDTSEFRLKPRYRLESGLTFGAYVEYVGISFDDDDASLTSYGATVGYDTGVIDVEVFYGQTDSDEGGSDTIDDYGLTLLYQPSEAVIVGASWMQSEVGSDDFNVGRLGGAYALNDNLTLFGGLEAGSFDDIDLTTFGIGASYSLTSVAGWSTAFSLELERTTLDGGFDDADLDTIRLGVTFPFGKGGVQPPLNSVAEQTLRPRHSAASSLVSQVGLF